MQSWIVWAPRGSFKAQGTSVNLTKKREGQWSREISLNSSTFNCSFDRILAKLHFAENTIEIEQLVPEIWAVVVLQKQFRKQVVLYFLCLAVSKKQYFQLPTDLAWSHHIFVDKDDTGGGVPSTKVYPGTCRWNGSQNQPPGITMTPYSVQKLV